MESWSPGDYCGPLVGYTGDLPAVFYVLPVEEASHDPGGWFGHVCSPHTFRECPDGSLEIRESIGHRNRGNSDGPYDWHGFLDEGNLWRLA